MFGPETQILQRLVVLVVYHGLAVGQTTSHYFLIQRPTSWVEAREFCQRHYVDLAVLSTEEQYVALLNATRADKVSFWLGLQRQSISSSWNWVNGEELGYKHWYGPDNEGCCASLEAMLKEDKKLLARYCKEPHMMVCQGPVSPQSVTVDSVGADHVNLIWNISAFMQMIPHSYKVTICTSTCKTLLYAYTVGSALMIVNMSDLTAASEYFIKISAFVIRPDNVTGEIMSLRDEATTLQVKTADSFEPHKIITMFLKLLKLVCLAPPLWILYRLLKKESNHDVLPVELSFEDTVIDLIPQKTRGIGLNREILTTV